MRFRTFILILLVALLASFTALNWVAFVTPTSLSLGFATFEAPLGVVMLAIVVGMALIFAGYMAFWQGRILLESRGHAKELQAQRTLADQAEASRFTELGSALASATGRMEARFDASHEALRIEMKEATHSLAAMIGEMDDRAKRLGDRQP
ncbi:MAG: LapA family protein [Caldimonas sp.]